MTLGEKIKNIRTNLKLTQAEFADKLYCSHHTVSKWECDINKPTLSDIELICSTYNIPLSEMLDIPVFLKENPYYEMILSTLYEFQLIASTKEMKDEVVDRMVTYSVRIDHDGKEKIIDTIRTSLDTLEEMGYIKRTKTEDFDVIQMTHLGLSSTKSVLSVDRECEEYWFGTYLYENKNALTEPYIFKKAQAPSIAVICLGGVSVPCLVKQCNEIPFRESSRLQYIRNNYQTRNKASSNNETTLY